MIRLHAFWTVACSTCLAAGLTAQDRPPDGKNKQDLGVKSKDTVTQVARDMQSAEERLKKTDPGDVTRKIQRDIIDGLDELIKQNAKASSGGGGSQQSSKVNQNASKQKSPDSGGASPKDMGQSPEKQLGPKNSQSQDGQDQLGRAKGGQDEGPQAKDKDKGRGETGGKDDPEGVSKGAGKDNDKDGKQGQAKANEPDKDDGQLGGLAAVKNETSRNARTDLTADLYRTDWGHLPLAKRLEMDAYSKERFMPRYDEALQQYYRTIAEQGYNKKD